MARVMFTYELAERLAPDGVTATCHCPGLVPVKRSDSSWLANAMVGLLRLIPGTRTPDQAAKTMEFLAVSPDASELTGVYFREGRRSDSHPQTHDKAARSRLWQETLRLTDSPSDPIDRTRRVLA